MFIALAVKVAVRTLGQLKRETFYPTEQYRACLQKRLRYETTLTNEYGPNVQGPRSGDTLAVWPLWPPGPFSEGGKPPLMSKAHGGYSQSARKRRRLAGALSQRLRRGDGDAAFRLLQRGRALRGCQKLGWRWRLALANAVRKRNHEELLGAKAAATERRRIEDDCTVTS